MKYNQILSNLVLILGVVLLVPAGLLSQADTQRNTNQLMQLSQQYEQQYQMAHQEALQKAQEKGWPVRQEYPNGKIIELQRLSENGMPVYYTTFNIDAAVTVSTDQLWPSGSWGYDLTGAGMTAGEWDGGGVLTEHQEFGGRVVQQDSPGDTSNHATHVAGTIVAAGVDPNAQGMAYEASLDAYKWDNDDSEMSSAASNGLLISNHSYGQITGWTWDGDEGIWYWYGDVNVSTTEDYQFGFYSGAAQNWDQIANNAPRYLIIKSAGNDRNESGPASGVPYKYWEPDSGDWVLDSTTTRNPDGTWDCIPQKGNAKNVLTLGAAGDIAGGYSSPSDVNITSFSSYGPTDDGRIKPDIVANGANLYSSVGTNQSAYDIYSGTSMSSPNTTGSLLLLRQLYQDVYQDTMLASTLKALVIHTADEADNNPGPDYSHGWGMLNTEKAAQVIANQGLDRGNLMHEENLTDGGDYTLTVNSDGSEPLRATIVWNDPAGTPPSASIDPTTKMLVNDLDLYLNGPSQTHQPYVMDPANPANAPTTGDNTTDNVEQVYIAAPEAGEYSLHVNHKGSLQGGNQTFSLIVTGASSFGADGPKPNNLVAGQGFDGIVPLTWDPPQGVAAERQINASGNEEGLMSDRYFEQAFEQPGENASAAVNAARTVDYYKIYRTTKPGGTYQMIGQIDPDDRYYVDEEDFIDRNVENDSTYYYAVSVMYEDGTEGALSDPVYGTPSASGHLVTSEYDASLFGGTHFNLTPADTNSTDDIDVYVVNNATELNINITDTDNDESSDYNEVGIYFDTDNDGTWDSSLPSDEGNLWVSMQGSDVNASFRSIYGQFPNDVHGSPIDDNPEGVTYTVSNNFSEMDYDITIDLQSSVINAQPGDTIGLRIYNLDMSQFSDTYYGMDSWPYGNIWLAPETYGKLVLATEPATLTAPSIANIEDYPEDQGGKITVEWTADESAVSPDYFTVRTRTTDGAEGSESVGRLRSTPSSNTNANWTVVDTITADGSGAYAANITTVADSNESGIPWTDVQVNSHKDAESVSSQIHQGYSVDNLAPTTPIEFTGKLENSVVQLQWQANAESDLSGYVISRALNARFSSADGGIQKYTTSDTTYVLEGQEASTYYYRLVAKDENGNVSPPSAPITVQATDTKNGFAKIPETFTLQSNYPNPFNPVTNVRYGIPEQAHVTVAVYDLLGNKINTLVNRQQGAGWYTIKWAGDNALGHQVGTGVYILQIQAGDFSDTQKMVFMK